MVANYAKVRARSAAAASAPARAARPRLPAPTRRRRRAAPQVTEGRDVVLGSTSTVEGYAASGYDKRLTK